MLNWLGNTQDEVSEVSLWMATAGLVSGAFRRGRHADPLGESAREMARHFYNSRIRGDAIQHREQPLRLGERMLTQVVLELMQSIVHSQPVVLQSFLEQHEVALLLKETFEDERQLGSRAV
jgi:hypothetical protein